MVRLSRPSTAKLLCIIALLGAALIVSLVYLLVQVSSLQAQRDDNDRFHRLMRQNISLVPGYACGILAIKDAEQLLDSKVKRNFEHGIEETTTASLRLVDTCRYESAASDARYVELIIRSYSNQSTAADEFDAALPLVGDSKQLDSSSYGDELYYDSGVYFLLRGNHVVEVTASNGIPSDIESFSRDTFDEVVSRLEF